MNVLGDVDWEGVGLAEAVLLLENGAEEREAARAIFERQRRYPLYECEEIVERLANESFVSFIKERTRMGSAENPITKLFPATITERRFLARLQELRKERPSLRIEDDRLERRGLTDFTLYEDEIALPINVKTATTLFRKAKDLVGLEPEDCLPIPAYKAHGALESVPDLVYVISPDWKLLDILPGLLESTFSSEERAVWQLLNRSSGSGIRDAEDRFVLGMVEKHWAMISEEVADNPFHVISARRAVKILHSKPKRTPGIGMRAWGTGASAEVNVHISIAEDTVRWTMVRKRIRNQGVENVIAGLRQETVQKVPNPDF